MRLEIKIIFVIYCFFISVTYIEATSFYPTPIRDQIHKSSGVIIGTFKSLSYQKTSSENIITNAYFSIDHYAGINSNELINPNAFRVIIPGGKWQGLIYHVHGAPTFVKDQRVALILNKGRHGYGLLNLGMSKFDFVNEGKKTFLISNIFSNKKGIGKISWSDFSELLEDKFQEGIEESNTRKIMHKKDVKTSFSKPNLKSRVPASIEEESRGPASGSGKIDVFWLVIILGILGSVSSALIKSNRDR